MDAGDDRISIIIPVYNRPDRLRQALESIFAQTRLPDEVVVVDDGSTDDIAGAVAAFEGRARYLRQDNSGASSARNAGALHSNGQRLLFLDADDALAPTAVEKLSSALDANVTAGASYCGWTVTEGPGHVVYESRLEMPSGRVFAQMCREPLCIVDSVMVRREVLAESGLFDTGLVQFEDIDFWVRVAEHAEFVFVNERLVEYRRWETGASCETKVLPQASQCMMARMKAYRSRGLLSADDWPAVSERFGRYYRLRHAAEAFRAYERGDWRSAAAAAASSFGSAPATLANRGVWAVLVKSIIRMCVPPRRSGENDR